MSRLAGRRVLVTGAAGGIGRAIADRLAEDGAEVLRTDLAAEPPDLACDVTDRVAVDVLVTDLVERAGPLWGVVHAAALCGSSGSFAEVSAADFRRYLDVNLVGAFHVLQAVARSLIAGGQGGRLVAVGSVNAMAAERDASPYVASKGGLRMLVKAAAVDLAPHGISANLVHPGPILVSRNAHVFAAPAVVESFRRAIPLPAPGEPAAVAEAVVYLMSPRATFTTGAEVVVDGGAQAYFV